MQGKQVDTVTCGKKLPEVHEILQATQAAIVAAIRYLILCITGFNQAL